MEIDILGIDLAKEVFQLHGADRRGRAVHRAKVSRGSLAECVRTLKPRLVVMEACSTAHHWARRFQSMGTEVRLISPQYVTPFVKTNKNDRNAFGNCVSQNAKAQSTSTENSQVQAQDKAAKTCRSQQSDPNFSTTTGGGKTFNQFYGTNKNDRNAFGKCVSKNAKAQEHSSSSTSS